ncbi:MAG: MATE family efflux transporter [Clostridium argentinense]|uniref:MATE family efflux transporter n=1 Tax=Clostridium butanoliproducens TaxID=2991837 RepID=UPI001DFBA5EA|nr:MATE family efflux transporter [Clostridium butanoliproducens]MBS5824139.1 MATE family efflux transporter [Clostridium argentinense]
MLNKKEIRNVLTIALPAVGEMVLYMMVWVLDTLMIGQYGGQVAVSTVGISGEILYTFANIFIAMGVSVAITSIVARRYGAKEYDIAEEYATIGFVVGTIISVLCTVIIFVFSKQLLTAAGCEPEVLEIAMRYIRIVCFGIVFNMITSLYSAIQRAYGNTKIPLITSFIVILINMILDYMLIFGKFGAPELGVTGAAIATITAQICGFLFSTYYTFKKSKIKVKFKYLKSLTMEKIKTLFKLSIPASLQEGAFSISRLLTTFMIMRLGTVAFSANTITSTLESLSYMPGWGFAVACTTLVGNKYGEKDYKGAMKYAYNCAILGLVSMICVASLFVIMPKFLIGLFINKSEVEVISLGATCLMIAAIQQPGMAISMIYGGALKGIGNTKIPFKVSLFTGWCIRLPLVFYFIYLNQSSVTYFWWICVIQWIVDAILIYISYKRKLNSLVKEHNGELTMNNLD